MEKSYEKLRERFYFHDWIVLVWKPEQSQIYSNTSQTANGNQVPKDLTLVTELFRSCLSQTNLKGVEPGESRRQAGDGAVGQQPVVDFVLQPEQREVVHEGERVEVGMDPNVGDLNFGSFQLAKDKKGSYWSRT